jgi:hypothetical protein
MKAAQEIATLEPNLLYHQVVVNTHINRFRVTYPEFFKLKETVKLVEYFFNRVYNLDGKQERDVLVLSTYGKFRSLISEKSRNRMENLINLNDITDRLDQQMAQFLRKREVKKLRHDSILSEAQIKSCYQKGNQLQDRQDQLNLLIHNLESFFELSKHPLAEVIMRPAYLAAVMVNAKPLYNLFEEGYLAAKPVSKETFYKFIDAVKKREKEYLDFIYKPKELKRKPPVSKKNKEK